ncbi:hypothetical protein BA939_13275 [Rhizobium sp. S41]|nr:hypothetical protein BA939_13275 [Rhizobium sp. S41]
MLEGNNRMLTPYAETQVADIIRDHATRKTPLKIFGGNTRSGFGNAVTAETVLTSRAIKGHGRPTKKGDPKTALSLFR